MDVDGVSASAVISPHQESYTGPAQRDIERLMRICQYRCQVEGCIPKVRPVSVALISEELDPCTVLVINYEVHDETY